MGRTGLTVNKDGFGALPLQRATAAEAARILNMALDAGIDYIDTARSYTDSEEKIGLALSGRRGEYVLATKTMAKTAEEFRRDLDVSLGLLKTERIDVYQFHNPGFVPRPGDGSGLYEAMLEAREAGRVRFIGFTNHLLGLAREAAASGLYDVLQFPLNYLSDENDLGLARLCREADVGFVAMKALSGGLITDIRAARAWMAAQDGVVPIWGIQSADEMAQLVEAMGEGAEGPTDAHMERIERDREELRGEFCRGCGYCMPCPAGIQINWAARMSLALRRMPTRTFLTEYWRDEMEKIKDCEHCGHCAEKCPYGLDPPSMLERNYEDFKTFI